jgi:hypothetical protein
MKDTIGLIVCKVLECIGAIAVGALIALTLWTP